MICFTWVRFRLLGFVSVKLTQPRFLGTDLLVSLIVLACEFIGVILILIIVSRLNLTIQNSDPNRIFQLSFSLGLCFDFTRT